MSTENVKIQLPIDIKGIQAILPHRAPFLLVDRIIELEEGVSITGLKNVSMGEPYFVGHFPGDPVMPGVLILEGMAQTGGILAYLSNPDMAGRLVYFTGIDNTRFRRVVRPGDQLVYKLMVLKAKSRLTKMSAHAYVDGQLAVQAEVSASFA